MLLTSSGFGTVYDVAVVAEAVDDGTGRAEGLSLGEAHGGGRRVVLHRHGVRNGNVGPLSNTVQTKLLILPDSDPFSAVNYSH